LTDKKAGQFTFYNNSNNNYQI